MTVPVGVAVVGCGAVSASYVSTFVRSDALRVVTCVDVDRSRAESLAEQADAGVASSLDAALADAGVELVVNLTRPDTHAEVSAAALRAGKALYSEKPLATTREQARQLLELAEQYGVRLACGPDTFLGPAYAEAERRLAVDGRDAIVGARAVSLWQPERKHHDPEFIYRAGNGPLLDMAPYQVTALVALIGPVIRVVATASQRTKQRTIGSGPRAGTRFAVNTPTHYTARLDFAGGVSASCQFGFEAAGATSAPFEIFTAGQAMTLPAADGYDAHLAVWSEGNWQVVKAATSEQVGRGMGVIDLARAMRSGEPHRADARRAFHVLDVLLSIATAAETGEAVSVLSTPEGAFG